MTRLTLVVASILASAGAAWGWPRGSVHREGCGLRYHPERHRPGALFPVHQHHESDAHHRHAAGFLRLHERHRQQEHHRSGARAAAVIAQMDTRRIPTPNATKSVLVYVPFLAPTQEEVTLRVQTVARDDLMMSPDVLSFGNIKSGTGAKMTTKVTFMSDPNWTITEATSTGGYVKAEFKQESRNGSLVTYEVTATLDKDCPGG